MPNQMGKAPIHQPETAKPWETCSDQCGVSIREISLLRGVHENGEMEFEEVEEYPAKGFIYSVSYRRSEAIGERLSMSCRHRFVVSVTQFCFLSSTKAYLCCYTRAANQSPGDTPENPRAQGSAMKKVKGWDDEAEDERSNAGPSLHTTGSKFRQSIMHR